MSDRAALLYNLCVCNENCTDLCGVWYDSVSRIGISLDNYSGLDDLPPVPKKKQQISRGETIFGIGISVVFLIVFLVCPQIFCAITKDGELIPILSTEVARNTWYIIVIFSALGIIREIVKLLELEAIDAFEERKNMAKKYGEEAGTKMLFPMIVMLVVVMGIIMLPAVMAFSV